MCLTTRSVSGTLALVKRSFVSIKGMLFGVSPILLSLIDNDYHSQVSLKVASPRQARGTPLRPFSRLWRAIEGLSAIQVRAEKEGLPRSLNRPLDHKPCNNMKHYVTWTKSHLGAYRQCHPYRVTGPGRLRAHRKVCLRTA